MNDLKGIVCLLVNNQAEGQTATPDIRKLIKIHYPELEDVPLVQSFVYDAPLLKKTQIKKDRDFEFKLKAAIVETAKAPDRKLIILSNRYLESFKDELFVDYLKLLSLNNIDFAIQGLENLNSNNIHLFIDIYEQKQENQAAVIAKAQQTSKKTRKPRQASIPGIKALNSEKTKNYNALRKRQMADLDPNNIYARKEIARIREKIGKEELNKEIKGYSISKKFNEKGIRTSRNSQFRPNVIDRQYEAFKELQKRFSRNRELEKKVGSDPAFLDARPEAEMHKPRAPKEQVPLVMNYQEKIEDQLLIAFSEPLQASVVMDIFNNESNLVFSSEIKEGTSKIDFSIANDTPIGPGRYYGRLTEVSEAEGGTPSHYLAKWFSFVVREDVVDLKVGDSQFAASDFR